MTDFWWLVPDHINLNRLFASDHNTSLTTRSTTLLYYLTINQYVRISLTHSDDARSYTSRTRSPGRSWYGRTQQYVRTFTQTKSGEPNYLKLEREERIQRIRYGREEIC